MLTNKSIWDEDSFLNEWIVSILNKKPITSMRYQPFEPEHDELLGLISKKHNISIDNIYVTAGISGAIFALLRSCFWSNVFLLTPDFGLYEHALQNTIYKNKICYLPIECESNITEYFESNKSLKTDLLCFSNPRWFTGEEISLDTINLLLKCFKGYILIDEAYIDFCDKRDILFDAHKENSRIIFMRSFSKGYFLPGIRVGYIVSSYLNSNFRKNGIPPHQISSLSYEVVIELLKNEVIQNRLEIHRTYVRKLRNFILYRIKENSNLIVKHTQASFGSVFWVNNEYSASEISKLKNVEFVNWPSNGFRYNCWNIDEANNIIKVLNHES